MARVSISEAARLVKVSRPTIYKMINSGKLSYTSVVKHGKIIKVIDTSELIRVFGSLDGVIDTVKSDAGSTGVNSVGLHDLQHRIALLEAENDGLKGAVKARDEHIDSLRQAMQLLEHKHEPSSPPDSNGGFVHTVQLGANCLPGTECLAWNEINAAITAE
ncbi:Excl1 protein [Klebsiella pneumoniae]|nr:Excl1 protein [Klebsiella pneumoniae]